MGVLVADERWQRAVADLKAEGLVKAVGISVYRWEPTNVVAALGTCFQQAPSIFRPMWRRAFNSHVCRAPGSRDLSARSSIPGPR